MLTKLVARYPTDPRVALLREALGPEEAATAARGAPVVVAVQSVEDAFYLALFGALVYALGQRTPVKAELIVVRATSGSIGTGWRAWLLRSVPMTWVQSTQWVRAFPAAPSGVGYRSHGWSHPLDAVADGWRSLRDWRRVRRASGEFVLSIDGLSVADLISDTYLRFRPAPAFDAADPFVLYLIWQARRATRTARHYFRRQRPALYLTSYATYIEHGVAARVALQEGVRVVSFGNFNRVGRELTLQDWLHTADTSRYRADFEALPDPDARLAEAERQLQVRLAGGIDAATGYMRASAYGASGKSVPAEVRGAVIVFLHDFYDSPHVYHDLVFPDFWTWIECTIATLSEAGIPFFLKPHPNQVSLSGEALLMLRAKHPTLRLLDSGLSNTELVEAGMLCGVTVYGTVAHELAYLGVHSISCARHPHHAYDFCRTAKTVPEYQAMLRTPAEAPLDAALMRRQALSFYYMHNLHGDPAALELRAAFIEFWRACHADHPTASTLLPAFDRMRRSPGFGALAADLIARTTEHAG